MIIFDGWSLVHHPNSAAALHLLTLLMYHPPEFPAIVALPGEPLEALPSRVASEIIPAASGKRGQRIWKKHLLPGLSKRMRAQLIHLTALESAKFASSQCVISPSDYLQANSMLFEHKFIGFERSWLKRFQYALSQPRGDKVRAILWPELLPAPISRVPLVRLPLISPPLIDIQGSAIPDNSQFLDLPDNYILCHGPFTDQELQRVVEAWSWVVASIGNGSSLLVVGLDSFAQQVLLNLTHDSNLDETIRILPCLSMHQLAGIYEGSSVVFQPAEISPWGSPAHLAISFGKPIVGVEMPRLDALVGPAAYLIPETPKYQPLSRSLGAALVSVIVDDELSASLIKEVQNRAALMQPDEFSVALFSEYKQLLG